MRQRHRRCRSNITSDYNTGQTVLYTIVAIRTRRYSFGQAYSGNHCAGSGPKRELVASPRQAAKPRLRPGEAMGTVFHQSLALNETLIGACCMPTLCRDVPARTARTAQDREHSSRLHSVFATKSDSFPWLKIDRRKNWRTRSAEISVPEPEVRKYPGVQTRPHNQKGH